MVTTRYLAWLARQQDEAELLRLLEVQIGVMSRRIRDLRGNTPPQPNLRGVLVGRAELVGAISGRIQEIARPPA